MAGRSFSPAKTCRPAQAANLVELSRCAVWRKTTGTVSMALRAARRRNNSARASGPTVFNTSRIIWWSFFAAQLQQGLTGRRLFRRRPPAPLSRPAPAGPPALPKRPARARRRRALLVQNSRPLGAPRVWRTDRLALRALRAAPPGRPAPGWATVRQKRRVAAAPGRAFPDLLQAQAPHIAVAAAQQLHGHFQGIFIHRRIGGIQR